MKVGGIILTVFGSLLILGSVNLAFTKYDLSNQHDLSKFLGGAAISLILLAIGIGLLIKSGKSKH